MIIKTLEDLWLSNSGLTVWQNHGLTKEKYHVFLQQGDLDGACGPYALMMSLIACGAISRADAHEIWLGKVKGTTKLGKEMKNLSALLRDGTTAESLEKLFNAIRFYFSNNHKNLQNLCISLTENKKRGNELVSYAKSQIDKNLPTIIRLDWKGAGAHWVTVVGYQKYTDQKDIPERLLCLDSGFQISNTSAWNGVLDVFEKTTGIKPYSYWSESSQVDKCDVNGCISFTRL